MSELSVIIERCTLTTKNGIQFLATVRVEGFIFSNIRHTRVYITDIEGDPPIIGPQSISIQRPNGLKLKIQRVPEIQMVFIHSSSTHENVTCMRHRTYAQAHAWA